MEKKADLMSLVEEIKALDLSAKLCGVIHIINDERQMLCKAMRQEFSMEMSMFTRSFWD